MKSIALLLLTMFVVSFAKDSGFYDLLGVTKQATERDIRKAFKKKALKLHPDKNKDDPDAQANFIELNRAYEVLKDEELRKKYDLYGEEGLHESKNGNQYHSWNYYHDNFGIYDDDIEIITLNKADFEQTVTVSKDIWFINYYHPMCSHCHLLAPVWRQVALELHGVVRIGAVNCDDEYMLCTSQGLQAYPTLISYPGRTVYNGAKTKDLMVNYILSFVKYESAQKLTPVNLPTEVKTCKKPWLIMRRDENEELQDFNMFSLKLLIMFTGMLCMYEIDCSSQSKLCSTSSMLPGVTFFPDGNTVGKEKGIHFESLIAQEVAKQIHMLLPDIEVMQKEQYWEKRSQLDCRNDEEALLLYFAGEEDEDNLEFRKLPSLVSGISVRKMHCASCKKECDELYIAKTPAFTLFKPGGGYDMHQGRLLAHDIAVFAKEGILSTKFQILTPKEFPDVLSNSKEPWFIDFYAPWCPPCMKLLPEIRKASRLIDVNVNFGSIDCTTHDNLCSRFNIRQYPTTILYNNTYPHQYHGHHTASRIVDFVKDTLHPSVIILDEDSFDSRVRSKKTDSIWVVDYHANWCGPCNQMSPEYNHFARLVADMPNVFVAKIDCAIYRHVCQEENVRSYPSIRLYANGRYNRNSFMQFNGWSRDASSFRQWLFNALPSNVVLLDDRSFEAMLRDDRFWVIDFHAPWCGPCQAFEPEFVELAQEFESKALFGKVNCESHNWICRAASVRYYPTVRIYEGVPNGVSRQNPFGFELETRDVQYIASTIRYKLRQKKGLKHDEL